LGKSSKLIESRLKIRSKAIQKIRREGRETDPKFLRKRNDKKPKKERMFTIDAFTKGIYRSFTLFLQMHFEMIYDRRSYHWQKSLLREETHRFFTQVYSDGKRSYNFCDSCYKENEYLFFKLLHNTKDPTEYQISPNNTIYTLKGESEQTFSQIL
jgi:hypothetical protein